MLTQVEVYADESARRSSSVSQSEAGSAWREVVDVLDQDRKEDVVGVRKDVVLGVGSCRK
jgi:hypothetical protein